MRSPRQDSTDEARELYWSEHDRQTHRCPDCGRFEDHPDVWRFEVHHKNENPFDNRVTNLVGLCHHCHRKRHGHEVRGTLEDWKMRGQLLGGIRQ